MSCGRCGELHTGGFMLALEPRVCVYCYYGIAVASDQYGAKTRAQDRAEAEARDEMFDHLDAAGHHKGIRSRVEGNTIIMKCEECSLEIERNADIPKAGANRRKNAKAPQRGRKEFCPFCDRSRLIEVFRRKETMKVRGTSIRVESILSRCRSCKKIFATQVQEEINICKAYALYKAKTGLSAYRRDRV